jgi:hypothetical protein
LPAESCAGRLSSNQYAHALKERELQGKFVELAVTILRDAPKGDSTRSLRSWATQVLDRYSGVPFDTARRPKGRLRQSRPGTPAITRRFELARLLKGARPEAEDSAARRTTAEPPLWS